MHILLIECSGGMFNGVEGLFYRIGGGMFYELEGVR